MSKNLRIVSFDVSGKQEKTIEYTLNSMQSLVKGYIQKSIPLKGKLVLVCNEEGKITDGAEATLIIKDKKTSKVLDIIYQPCFITKFDYKDDFRDLTDANIDWIERHYSYNINNMKIGVLSL